MALFENILGTRPQRMGERPPAARPAQFRPIGRMERADPEIRALYERQRRQWEEDKKAEDEAYAAYSKEMQAKYGENWESKLVEETRAKQREESRKSAAKAAEDMRSGKTSNLVGAAAGGIPTFKPETFDANKAEGPVQVRKAIPQQRVFKAMIEGKPDKSKVFDSQKEADKYLQEEYNKRVSGLQTNWRKATDRGDTATAKKLENQIKSQRMGVVASVRGTPEEMARYKEESTAEQRKQAAFKEEYDKRIRPEATARTEKLRSAMRYYDEATTPEQRAAAKSEIEAARLEGMFEEATRGMPQEQKQKVATGLAGVLQGRGEREARVQRGVAQAREESRAQQEKAGIAAQGIENERAFQRIIAPLYRESRQAARDKDYFRQFQLEGLIAKYTQNVPRDERARKKFFVSEAGRTWRESVNREMERSAEEEKARQRAQRNPT